MGPKVTFIEDRDVDDALDVQIRALLTSCFPSEARFQARRYFEEPPFRRWFVRDSAGQLAAQLCVHMKVVGSSVGDLSIGGVAEVAVDPSHRGQGLVRLMLAELHDWLDGRASFALLFGNPAVYSSSGYVPILNVIRSTTPATGELVQRSYENAMIKAIGDVRWPDGLIDLRGPTF
jgi:predicted acetyltransferase